MAFNSSRTRRSMRGDSASSLWRKLAANRSRVVRSACDFDAPLTFALSQHPPFPSADRKQALFACGEQARHAATDPTDGIHASLLLF